MNTTKQVQEETAAATTTTTTPVPTNPLVTALLTDLYQITMTYAYWKNHRQDDPAIFELFFRKNPFGGEYTIFAGLDECLKHLTHFRFSASDITYLRTAVPSLQHCDPAFFDWLAVQDASQNVTVHAMLDGTVCFPRIPLLIIEAPLAIGQLLETTLLTLVNYPSLLATNAARMVLAASNDKTMPNTSTYDNKPAQCWKRPVCIEFGLRRAQGPDGGFSASKYAAVGGFVGTSNVQAGKWCHLPVMGTHAHAFVQTYSELAQVADCVLVDKKKKKKINNSKSSSNNDDDVNSPTTTTNTTTVQILPRVLEYRQQLSETHSTYYQTTNDGELAAFIAYATAFPDTFLCLIDTYDTLHSGLLNFILVALVLDDLGYTPKGIRLDSGDLAYLSLECANVFHSFATERAFMKDLEIVASNDINEAVLHALNKQNHAITMYGIGTNLVTCQAQPALGCVYKLVEIAGRPRMKLSQDIAKVIVPGQKKAYRLTGKDGCPILDVMVGADEPSPVVGERILCRHPFVPRKRAAVIPSQVDPLHHLVFEKGKVVPGASRSLTEAREAVREQLKTIRPDILRYINPTPYKVSVSDGVFQFLHELWQAETPVAELS